MIIFYYEIAPFNSMISRSLSLWRVVRLWMEERQHPYMEGSCRLLN